MKVDLLCLFIPSCVDHMSDSSHFQTPLQKSCALSLQSINHQGPVAIYLTESSKKKGK